MDLEKTLLPGAPRQACEQVGIVAMEPAIKGYKDITHAN